MAALVVALIAPLIGATADRAGLARFWLLLFSLLAIICCFGLAFIGKGDYTSALMVFALAVIGANAANAIYDGLLTEVTSSSQYHRLSLVGYACGYLGGAVMLSFNFLCTLHPQRFGLANEGEAVKLAFICVAVWWLIFMLPLLIHTKKRSQTDISIKKAIAEGCSSLWNTAKHIRSQKPVLMFLIAYWFYIDGVGTVYRMAVDFGKHLEFKTPELFVAILLVQFISFPAALGFTYIAKYMGAKKGIYLGIAIYSCVSLGAAFIKTIQDFYILAALVALAQGGLQSLSRSYFALLIPKNKSGEYFGFYNAFGRFAAIIGPILMVFVKGITGSYRLSMVSILLLFILGAIFLSCIKDEQPKAKKAV